MERDITDLEQKFQKQARKPLAARFQVNNNLLSFPYGDSFKKREGTSENLINCDVLKHARPKMRASIEPSIAPERLHDRGIVAEKRPAGF